LFVLDVHVTPAGPLVLSESPTFLGCKTWVELGNTENSELTLDRASNVG